MRNRKLNLPGQEVLASIGAMLLLYSGIAPPIFLTGAESPVEIDSTVDDTILFVLAFGVGYGVYRTVVNL